MDLGLPSCLPKHGCVAKRHCHKTQSRGHDVMVSSLLRVRRGVVVQTPSPSASLLDSKQSFLNLEEEATSATSIASKTDSTAG